MGHAFFRFLDSIILLYHIAIAETAQYPLQAKIYFSLAYIYIKRLEESWITSLSMTVFPLAETLTLNLPF